MVTDGKLDIAFLYNIVKDKRNFHCEINILQSAIKNAKITLSNQPNNDVNIPIYLHHTNELYNWEAKRSRFFYANLLEQVVIRPTSQQFWKTTSNMRITEDILEQSYKSQIKQIKDKKLSETNFKILHNILPCNSNLYKWGKKDTKLCSFCNVEETICHLLFQCTYAKQIWSIVGNILGDRDYVNEDMVIFGIGLDRPLIYVFSMIIYYIYKEWLVCSLHNRIRKRFCVKSLIGFLKIRLVVYSNSKNSIWHDVCMKLEGIISALELCL